MAQVLRHRLLAQHQGKAFRLDIPLHLIYTVVGADDRFQCLVVIVLKRLKRGLNRVFHRLSHADQTFIQCLQFLFKNNS